MGTVVIAVLVMGLLVTGIIIGRITSSDGARSLRKERNLAKREVSLLRSGLYKIAANDAGNPALEAQLTLSKADDVSNRKELN